MRFTDALKKRVVAYFPTHYSHIGDLVSVTKRAVEDVIEIECPCGDSLQISLLEWMMLEDETQG